MTADLTAPKKSRILGSIEYFEKGTAGYVSGHDALCARCGSDTYHVTCWNCGGDGTVIDEDPINGDEYERCEVCRGRGGWLRCMSSREWCDANPRPGREGITSTAREKGEPSDD